MYFFCQSRPPGCAWVRTDPRWPAPCRSSPSPVWWAGAPGAWSAPHTSGSQTARCRSAKIPATICPATFGSMGAKIASEFSFFQKIGTIGSSPPNGIVFSKQCKPEIDEKCSRKIDFFHQQNTKVQQSIGPGFESHQEQTFSFLPKTHKSFHIREKVGFPAVDDVSFERTNLSSTFYHNRITDYDNRLGHLL